MLTLDEFILETVRDAMDFRDAQCSREDLPEALSLGEWQNALQEWVMNR